ncbi:MAG: TIGR01457 family HAD-type hydrolase [Lactobacillaceae bacterium]|nr:TIGR01457 family HAD-type hydrolase [Lactobacillaceae bacterium]
MSKYQGYFIDLDGTIYQGTTPIPAAKRFIQRLEAAGVDYLYLTNNSTKTPEMVADFLTQQHGIPTTTAQVYTSAMATADYVATLPDVQRVLVVGEVGLRNAITAKGFEIVDTKPADAVVIGMDRQLTYDKLREATFAIQAGAKFIATNIDTNLPTELGMQPGAGALVAALQTAVQQEPVVIGKPYTLIMDGALQVTGHTKDEVVMVGDNYNTDILAGLNSDIATLLVYTGVSTPDQVHAAKLQPTHEINNFDEWEI